MPATRTGSASTTTGSPTPISSAASVAVLGADVDVHLAQLDHLLALLLLEQVDRLAPDHALDSALAPLDQDPLSDEDLRVPAPDRGEVGKPLLVDMGDHQTDLVDVADNREQGLGALVADPGDRGADPVRAQFGEGGGLPPDGGGRALVAGGRRGAKERVE